MRWPIMAEPEETRRRQPFCQRAGCAGRAPCSAPIGVGQVLRSAFSRLRAAHVPVMIVDAFGRPDRDPHLAAEFGEFVTDRVGDGIEAFFAMNGDEVARVFEHMGARAEGSYRNRHTDVELGELSGRLGAAVGALRRSLGSVRLYPR